MLKYICNIVCIIFILFVFSGCQQTVPVPNLKNINNVNKNDFQIKEYKSDIEYQGMDKEVVIPAVGERNAFGVKMSSELRDAYQSFLFGDGKKAIEKLTYLEKKTEDPLTLWQISFLKNRAYMVAGLDADAAQEIKRTFKYEEKVFGHQLNSLAMLGQIYLMEGETKKAKEAFNKVLNSIGNWELPTSYGMPPSNLQELVSLATAKLRSLTGKAIAYLFEENYEKAYFWANEAEKRFSDIHYISNHPLYGMFFNSYLDSYYGRAMNMVTLSCALLALDKDMTKQKFYFDEALKFFKSINYTKGGIIAYSLKAQTLSRLKKFEEAIAVSSKALKLANENKIYDFVWRLELIRGIYFYEIKEFSKAETSLRNAATGIDFVSGNLQTDFSKRRFNAGKDELIYYLTKINLKTKNYKQLIEDLEQSRARAFIDMMRDRFVYKDQQNPILQKIREIDLKIKEILIANNIALTKENNSKLLSLQQEKNNLLTKLQKSDQQALSLVSSGSFDTKQLQSNLKKGEKALYFLPHNEDEKLKALIISKSSIVLKEFNLTSKELGKIMDSFFEKIDVEQNSLSSQTRSFRKKIKKTSFIKRDSDSPLAKLHHNMMIDSINAQRLYIVNSGKTSYIPWGTFITDKEIAILPSLQWSTYTANKTSSNNIVLVGNPDFAGELPQLQGATVEVQELGKLYNENPILFKKASLQNIQNTIGEKAKVLHLATHGVFYHDKPLESAIFLTKDSKLHTLTAQDIFQNPLNVELVVLSACETGMGKSSAGDDLLGLPRSFFLGGTKAVVSSLWPISDKATKVFMVEFHKYAQKGEYLKGLLQAQKKLYNEGYEASEYGAFVLYGRD